jgi:hypothetical protein
MIKKSYISVVEQYHSINVDAIVRKEKYWVRLLSRLHKESKLSKAEIKKQVIERLDKKEWFNFDTGESKFQQRLEFAIERTPFNGVRIYFYCPNCYATVRKLYSTFNGSGYACRYCRSLSYYLQKCHNSSHEGIIKQRPLRRKLEEFREMMKEPGRRWSANREYRYFKLQEKYLQANQLLIRSLQAIAVSKARTLPKFLI